MAAGPNAAELKGFVESQGNAGRRGVAESLEIVEDLGRIDAQLFHGGVDDAHVGLVEYDQVDVLEAHFGRLEDFPDAFAEHANRPLEDGPALHVQELASFACRGGRERLPRTAHGTVQQVRSRTVGTDGISKDSLAIGARAQHDRTGAISKQRISLSVGRIDHPRIGVGPDHQGALAATGAHVLHAGNHRKNETGAGRRNVERRRRDVEPLLHDARRCRHEHVGCEGAQHEQVDVFRIDLGGGNAPPPGLDRHIAGGRLRARVPPLQNARPLYDPIGIIAQGRQILVANPVLRNAAAGPENLHPHQSADPGSPMLRGGLRTLLARLRGNIRLVSRVGEIGDGHNTRAPPL